MGRLLHGSFDGRFLRSRFWSGRRFLRNWLWLGRRFFDNGCSHGFFFGNDLGDGRFFDGGCWVSGRLFLVWGNRTWGQTAYWRARLC
jgi:hypothetical protein